MSDSNERKTHLPKSRRVGVYVARGYCIMSSLYLLVVIYTILKPEHLQFERLTIPSYYIAVPLGIVYGAVRTPNWIKMSWLTVFTVACLGRSLSLMTFDIDYLSRWQQVAASLSWLLIWIGGILSALVLTANEIIEGRD